MCSPGEGSDFPGVPPLVPKKSVRVSLRARVLRVCNPPLSLDGLEARDF